MTLLSASPAELNPPWKREMRKNKNKNKTNKRECASFTSHFSMR
jgi:hypothetical protein